MSKDTVTINGIEHDLYPMGRIAELEAALIEALLLESQHE